MSSTASSRTFVSALAGLFARRPGCASLATGEPLHQDDFRNGLGHWHIEAEKPGTHHARADGVLDIDVPAGVTLWFKPRLEGPVVIEFEATAVAEGGPNDQVSDLNVFWMAGNAGGEQPVFATPRSGAFARVQRPADVLRGSRRQPQHHHAFPPLHRRPGQSVRCCPNTISARAAAMLVPNRKQRITLIAERPHHRIPARWPASCSSSTIPRRTSRGWFALRTTCSHLRIERLRIYRPLTTSAWRTTFTRS